MPLPASPLRRARRRVRQAMARPAARLAARAVPGLHQAWMRLVWRTSRVEDAGLGRLREIAERHGGVVALVWHEDLLLAPYACARLGLRPATLASTSDAGEVATRLLERCGFAVVRGASSLRDSRSRPLALRALILRLRREPGLVCALAVDGSRGPRRRLKRGAVALARASGRPIVLARIAARPSLALPTWDRLLVPLPFGAIRLALRGPFEAPPETATREGRERFRARIERELVELAEERASAAAARAPAPTRSESG